MKIFDKIADDTSAPADVTSEQKFNVDWAVIFRGTVAYRVGSFVGVLINFGLLIGASLIVGLIFMLVYMLIGLLL